MLKIIVKGTQLRIVAPQRKERDVLDNHIFKRYTTFAFKRNKFAKSEIAAVYAQVLPDGDILLHANVLEDIKIALTMYNVLYTVEVETLAVAQPASFSMRDHIVLRDYQEKAITFLATDSPTPTKLLGFPAGTGKTISFLAYAAHIGKRVALCAKPTYCSQWLKVIPSVTTLTIQDIVFVNSAKQIVGLQKKLIDGSFTYSIVLFSNKALQGYLKPKNTDRYLMPINDFMSRLGIQTLVIDEVHEDLHFNYLLATAISVPQLVGLSATLVTRDRKIESFQKIMFPIEDRYDLLLDNPYIEYIECTINYPFGVTPETSVRGSTAYSHIAYETWLLNNKVYLTQFLGSIYQIVHTAYLSRRNPGEKILIFAMRRTMCAAIYDALTAILKDSLSIALHIEDSEYNTLLESDIIISTPIKAGAAVDIPGLITVCSTYMTGSIQRLIQMLGRLRRIENRDTIYVQMLAGGIEKQLNYQMMNKDIIQERTRNYHTMSLPTYDNLKR